MEDPNLIECITDEQEESLLSDADSRIVVRAEVHAAQDSPSRCTRQPPSRKLRDLAARTGKSKDTTKETRTTRSKKAPSLPPPRSINRNSRKRAASPSPSPRTRGKKMGKQPKEGNTAVSAREHDSRILADGENFTMDDVLTILAAQQNKIELVHQDFAEMKQASQETLNKVESILQSLGQRPQAQTTPSPNQPMEVDSAAQSHSTIADNAEFAVRTNLPHGTSYVQENSQLPTPGFNANGIFEPESNTTAPIVEQHSSNSTNSVAPRSVSGMIHPFQSYTNKPEATIILSKGIHYDTWLTYLKLALQSAGLLYLVDPTLPKPVPFDQGIYLAHKARFLEAVGKRLQISDLNRVSHINDPMQLMSKLDELKKPPYVGRTESVVQEFIEMKYNSLQVNPQSFLNAFEKKLHELSLLGTKMKESFVSNRLYNAVTSVIDSVAVFSHNYQASNRVPFTPYVTIRDFFLAEATRKRMQNKNLYSSVAQKVVSSPVNLYSSPNFNNNNNKNKRDVSSGWCRRCRTTEHDSWTCTNKTCPTCRVRPVDDKHIKACAMSQRAKVMAKREDGQKRHQEGMAIHEAKLKAKADRLSSPHGVVRGKGSRGPHRSYDDRGKGRPSKTKHDQTAAVARYIRWANGRFETCKRHEVGAQALYTEGNDSGISIIRTCADSGCTIHLFGSKQGLSNVETLRKPKSVMTANSDENAGLLVTQKGDLRILDDFDRHINLPSVHIHENAIDNLLSLRPFTQSGNPVLFFDDSVHVLEKGSITKSSIQSILTGFSDKGLWFFDLRVAPRSTLATAFSSVRKTMPQQVLPDTPYDDRLTFENIENLGDLNEYLANVPHCSLDDLKKLEKQEIRTIRGQLARLWHFRLGHPSVEYMRKLALIIPELQGINIPDSIKDCHPCRVAKSRKIPHTSERRRASRPLEMIHTDVLGPVLPDAYPNGEEFLLGIVDDYTRYGFVFGMKSKSEVHLGLKAFYDLMDATLPYPYKTDWIRMDNGTEYKTPQVKKFLAKKNIKEDLAPPYTSPLNGVAERFLLVIGNCDRSLLVDSGLPKRMWLYAAQYAALVYNALPKAACGDQVPHCVLYQRMPKLKFLRRFGCVAHAHLPKKVGKFSDRSLRKYFVGLTNNGALLLDVSSGSVQNVSNAVFTESQVYGHHYGPFEITKFRDPIKLRRTKSKNNDFAHLHDDSFRPPPAKNMRWSSRVDFSDDLDDLISERFDSSFFSPPSNPPSAALPSCPMPAYPALCQTSVEYAPTREESSQPLPVDSRMHRALMTRHYLEKSIDSHIMSDSIDLPTDSASSRYDDPAMTYERFLSLFTADSFDEPNNYKEAVSSPNYLQWKIAMDEEFESMEKNHTWSQVSKASLPKGTRIIDSTWIFRLKTNKDGSDRFRARLVARGFKDTNSYDISEIYAPVADVNDIRAVLAYANKLNLDMYQLDIKVAFLNGVLEKPVYMHFPQGLEIDEHTKKTKVLRLLRSLYGLKVSPKRWFERFRNVITKLGFKPFVFKPCIFKWRYTKAEVTKIVILVLYVDDILLIGDCKEKIVEVISKLKSEFEITDLGTPKKFLGIDFVRDRIHKTLLLTQQSYTTKMLASFGFMPGSTPLKPTPILTLDASRKRKRVPDDCELPSPTRYRAAIGSLIHLMNCTRPDIAFAVNVVSRAQANPTSSDWEAVRRIFEYLCGTVEKGLLYRGLSENIECFTDASLGTNDLNARSTSGYVIYVYGDPVSWRTKKQTHVALSSAEAEYVAASLACRQVVSLKSLLQFLCRFTNLPVIYEDNISAIHLAKSLEQKSLKHIVHLCFHHIRFEVLNRNVGIQWVPSGDNIADTFTKALPEASFSKFRDLLVSSIE